MNKKAYSIKQWQWGRVATIAAFAMLLNLGVESLSAQDLSSLNSQRAEAQREIERIDKELSELKNSTTDLKKKLSLCNKRLSERQKILRSIDSQMSLLNTKEKNQSAQATRHTEKLEEMRSAYKKTARKLYTTQNINQGTYLYLSDSLKSSMAHNSHSSQIMLKSIKTLSDSISTMQNELGVELREIASRKVELSELKNDASEALKEIEFEQREIKTLERKLGGKTQQLNAQREAKLAALATLQRQIEEVIRKENEKNTPKGEESKLYTINSKDFAANKGKMPSPMIGAKIVDSYGLHNHPTLSGLKIDNKGVNLKGSAGQGVRVIAGGEVRKIFMVTGMGASVLVRHGEYLTVYSNLKSVSTKVGEEITSGQFIGEVGDDGLLHFEIWKETTTQNPSHWVLF